MADAFSAAANVAAVIGLIDVMCRAGKEIYGFVTAVKNASKEIKDLQWELQSIDDILWNTRRCCENHMDQLPTTSEDSSAIDSIGSTLKRIEIEYATLSEIITRNIRTKDGRPKTKSTQRLIGSIAWVINGDIGRSCEKLERYKSQLCVDLSILGRYNDLALSRRLDTAHKDVLSSSLLTQAGFQALDRNVKDLEVVTRSGYKNLSQKLQDIDHASHKYRDSFKSITESQMQIQEKIDSMAVRLMAMGHAVGGDAIGVSHGWETQKESLQSVTLPLMLLKPKLQEALLRCMVQNQDGMVLSTEDATWVRSEFEDLLATSHETAAAATRTRRRSTKSNAHKSHPIAVKSEPCGAPPSSRPIRHDLDGKASRKEYMRTKITTSSRCLQQLTAVGNFSVRLEWEKEKSTGQFKVARLYVLFAPGRAITEGGLFVSLSRVHHDRTQPSICRQISTYAVVDNSSPLFTCVRENDIVLLRDLLSRRMATPQDRNVDNDSILSYAARLLRVDICELLLNEGADPANCRGDGASAIYDFRNAFWYRSTDYPIPKATTERLLRAFIAAGCDPDASALGGNPLHFTVNYLLPGSRMIGEEEICTLIEILLRLGADLEHRTSDGLTPLLYNTAILGWRGFVVLRELLKWGADPHAVTDFSENALHLSLAFAAPRLSEEEESGCGHDNSLVDRLVLLLQAGCDPCLLNSGGRSPSDFALSSPGMWFQWCLAIEKSGVTSLDDVLEMELDDSTFQLIDPEEINDWLEETDGWETCSSDDSEEEAGYSEQFCSDIDHVFFYWDGFFPWKVPPTCRDCGLDCHLEDINSRKRDAWDIFRALKASSTCTYSSVDSDIHI